ncbi:MAG: lamin tail domain-containing protein [Gammaproteobacteria bacterium]|jgi:predicted extracellular nuclease
MYGLVLRLRAIFGATMFLSGILYCSLSHALVISQIYGGGGNSGSVYTNDFIEIFNNSSTIADLSGMSVQYASATSTNWKVTPLGGTLDPFHYYLVQEKAGRGSAADLPTPDAFGTVGLSTANGKIALVKDTAALTITVPCESSLLLDLVGYGTADCYEGAAGPSPSNFTALTRDMAGLQDTNSNLFDFSLLAPNPHNMLSAANIPIGAAPAAATNSVSEPASWWLLAGGLVVLRWRLMRRRCRSAYTAA